MPVPPKPGFSSDDSPDGGTGAVGKRNQSDEDEQHGRHLGTGKHLNRIVHLLTQPSRTHKTENNGGANGAFPTVDGVAG